MGLRKKVIEQRVELLKLLCHEVKISENGNYYGVPLSFPINEQRTIELNEKSLRKGNFYLEYGKKRTFKIPPLVLLMANKHGLQMIKTRSGNWTKLTLKRFERINFILNNDTVSLDGKSKVGEIFQERIKDHPIYKNKSYEDIAWHFYFKGRKAEYIAQYRGFLHMPIFGNFTSIKEAKKFFGYDFMGDDEFYKTMTHEESKHLFFYASTLQKKDRLSLIHHIKEGRLRYLKDIYNQWKEIRNHEGEEDFPFFRIPSSHPELRLIHDDISYKYNFFKAADFSDAEYEIESELMEEFKKEGLKFDILSSERKVFLAGCRSHHCISSRTRYMGTDIFFSFYVGGEIYDCQCKNNKIYEFRGYHNKSVPEDYRKRVQKCFDICLERSENERQDSNEPLQLWKVKSPESKEEVNSIDAVLGQGVHELDFADDLPF